jgi:hypothetical protein
MLKEILKDRALHSNDDLEEAIPKIWDEFIFNEVHSVFYKSMSRLARANENGGEYIIEYRVFNPDCVIARVSDSRKSINREK